MVGNASCKKDSYNIISNTYGDMISSGIDKMKQSGDILSTYKGNNSNINFCLLGNDSFDGATLEKMVKTELWLTGNLPF